MAHKYRLPIIDIESASFARREESHDNLHYHLANKANHDNHLHLNVSAFDDVNERWRNGNAVSHSFAQMVLAAMLQLDF